MGIPGAFASWEIWAPTFELLSSTWRVVGLDHDGVGQTKTPFAEITRPRHLESLLAVLDDQGVDRCVIAGDSSNATLALEAVLAEPSRFAGLAIVNGHAWGFDRPEAHRFVDGLRNHFEVTIDYFVKVVFPEPDSDHLQQWLRDIIFRTGPEAAAHLTEMFYTVDLRSRLGEVTVPTLIIHGALDVISPTALEDASHLAAAIPGAELQLLSDAGHLPLLSRPQQVADHLDRFLGRVFR